MRAVAGARGERVSCSEIHSSSSSRSRGAIPKAPKVCRPGPSPRGQETIPEDRGLSSPKRGACILQFAVTRPRSLRRPAATRDQARTQKPRWPHAMCGSGPWFVPVRSRGKPEPSRRGGGGGEGHRRRAARGSVGGSTNTESTGRSPEGHRLVAPYNAQVGGSPQLTRESASEPSTSSRARRRPS